jgi:hypothetical protein
MNGDDSRGNYGFQQRKPSPHKSVYSPNTMYGNPGYTQGQHPQHSHSQHPQQQKRRPPFNKSNHGNNNSNDRLIKQNDQIIKLLKEIRDRLPATASSVSSESGDELLQKTNLTHDEDVSLVNESENFEMSEIDSGDEDDNSCDEEVEVGSLDMNDKN